MSALRYLVIDDDPAFSAMLSRALARRGCDTRVANDADTALAVLTEWTPDRAILDLKLEHESGLTLLPRLKALQPDLDVVILTGYSSIATAVEAIKLGASNYLCKPAGIEEILGAFGAEGKTPVPQPAATPPSVERLQWEHIQRVLQEHGGNISATARALGMHRRTLQRKLTKRPRTS